MDNFENIAPDGYALHHLDYQDTQFGRAMAIYWKHNLWPLWKWTIELPERGIRLEAGKFLWSQDFCEKDVKVQIEIALPDIIEFSKGL